MRENNDDECGEQNKLITTRRGALASIGTAMAGVAGVGTASAQGGVTASVDPDPPKVGEEATFTAEGDFAYTTWYLIRPDGSYESVRGLSASITFEQTGSYTAYFRGVTAEYDYEYALLEGTVEEEDEGPVPTAVIDYSPSSPVRNPVTFDGSDSTTPEGEIESYEWYLRSGDARDDRDLFGSSLESGVTYEEYLAPGEWDVGLKVTNSAGNSAKTDTTVDVAKNQPEAQAEFSPIVEEEEPRSTVRNPVTLDASGSSTPFGELTSYEWTLGKLDGSGTEVAELERSGETVTESFEPGYTYIVDLVVENDAGNTDDLRDGFYLKDVGNTPSPSIDVSPEQPVEGNPVTFDASDSTTPFGDIESYEWYLRSGGARDERDLFDSSLESGVTYEESLGAGEWDVGLEVTNTAGNAAKADITIEVAENQPEAQAEFSPIVEQAEPRPDVSNPVTLDASGSSTPFGEITSYEWTLGKLDGTGTEVAELERSGETVTESFEPGYTYIVELVVENDTGQTDDLRDGFYLVE